MGHGANARSTLLKPLSSFSLLLRRIKVSPLSHLAGVRRTAAISGEARLADADTVLNIYSHDICASSAASLRSTTPRACNESQPHTGRVLRHEGLPTAAADSSYGSARGRLGRVSGSVLLLFLPRELAYAPE